MSERARLVLLISIMVVVALASSIAARAFLYNAAFDKQRARLVEAAQSQARLIESIARFDINYSQGYPGGPLAAAGHPARCSLLAAQLVPHVNQAIKYRNLQ